MSWYDSSWHFREAVAVHNSTSGTTLDIQFIVPPSLQRFWSNVASNGYDVRVTASDGVTALPFNLASFTYATQTLTVNVNDYVLPGGNAAINGKTVALWLYWGFDDGSSGTASDATSSFTVSNEITSTAIEIGLIRRSGAPIIPCRTEAPTSTTPTPEIAMKPGETMHVWWDFRRFLATRKTKYNGSLLLEEIDMVDVAAENSSQADVTSTLLVESETRIMHPGFVRTTIKAISGDVSSNYMVTLTVTTTAGRTLAFPALVKLRTFTAPAA